MTMPGRKFTLGEYRYGFNGKEMEDEITIGDLDFGARIYDSRIGRWLSVDPLQSKYSFLTPYHFAGNNPTASIDRGGLDTIRFVTTVIIHEPYSGLGGMKFGGAAYTSAQVKIIPAPGADIFYVDVTTQKNSAHGQSSSTTKTTEFFPNARLGDKGGVLGGSSNITKSGVWWQSGDLDVISLSRISSDDLVTYLEKHDPNSYGGIHYNKLGIRLQSTLQTTGQVLMLMDGVFTGLSALTSAKSVWSLVSVKRGLEIERLAGGNLPKNFPVIDKWVNNTVTSIKSVDLTAASYQEPSKLRSLINGYANKLAEFNGKNFSGVNVPVNPQTLKTLEVFYQPGVGTQAQLNLFSELQGTTSGGVKLIFTAIK